jgi:hypothetical protein
MLSCQAITPHLAYYIYTALENIIAIYDPSRRYIFGILPCWLLYHRFGKYIWRFLLINYTQATYFMRRCNI